MLAFADPAGELTWTTLKTWGGEDNASTARAQVAALSGDEFQLIHLGRHDFDSVNSGLVFGLGKRRWKFFPLDLDRGAYEFWLNARYDASTNTLFIERLVARK